MCKLEISSGPPSALSIGAPLPCSYRDLYSQQGRSSLWEKRQSSNALSLALRHDRCLGTSHVQMIARDDSTATRLRGRSHIFIRDYLVFFFHLSPLSFGNSSSKSACYIASSRHYFFARAARSVPRQSSCFRVHRLSHFALHSEENTLRLLRLTLSDSDGKYRVVASAEATFLDTVSWLNSEVMRTFVKARANIYHVYLRLWPRFV